MAGIAEGWNSWLRVSRSCSTGVIKPLFNGFVAFVGGSKYCSRSVKIAMRKKWEIYVGLLFHPGHA